MITPIFIALVIFPAMIKSDGFINQIRNKYWICKEPFVDDRLRFQISWREDISFMPLFNYSPSSIYRNIYKGIPGTNNAPFKYSPSLTPKFFNIIETSKEKYFFKNGSINFESIWYQMFIPACVLDVMTIEEQFLNELIRINSTLFKGKNFWVSTLYN